MNIRRDDTVLVMAGKDKGKRGRVREVHTADHKIIVEGINIIKKHTTGQAGARQAGVVEREAPLDASKVMVICPKCGKAVRVGHTVLATGQKARQCRNCGEVFEADTEETKWGGRR